MPRYETTFTINATPETIWKVITGFGRYGQWNPQIVRALGAAEEGSPLNLKLKFPKRPGMSVSARIEAVERPNRLAWKGNFVAGFIFSGERELLIEPAADGAATVTHIENVTGALAPFFNLAMGGPVEASHQAMDDALKQRCEAEQASAR